MITFSVIVATLRRPSLLELLKSLEKQTLDRSEWELIIWDAGFNEYDARNQAAKVAQGKWLVFTDDDCIVSPTWLQSASKFLQKQENQDAVSLSGPLEGDLWGHGTRIRLEKPHWYMGANLFVFKEAFDSLGGFETDWGLSPAPRGWRSDSDLGFRLEDKFGIEKCKSSTNTLVFHPRSMQSVWQPEVERLFYLRHRAKCLERFAPVDPRMCQFILQQNIETDKRTKDYLIEQLSQLSKLTNQF
jgi:glycosyltransferase involved in cell wall biosynthesis